MIHTNKGDFAFMTPDELMSYAPQPMTPGQFARYAATFLVYAPEYMHGDSLKNHSKRTADAVNRFSSPSFIAFEGEDSLMLACILEAFREICASAMDEVDAEEYGSFYVAAGDILSRLPDAETLTESIK